MTPSPFASLSSNRKLRALAHAAMGVFVFFLIAPSIALAQYSPYYPYYREPSYSLPQSAALGPWPFNFDIGGGPTSVIGNTGQNLTNGGNFTFGGGYNFTPQAGFVIEYMDSALGLSAANIQSNGAIAGDANVWGITINPIWRYRIDGPIGGYLIGGGGYYERDVRYVEPFTFTFPNNATVTGTHLVYQDSSAGGVNIGTGLTWNFGWGTKLFMEVRYHYILTSGYPTQIMPITFGLRW